MKKILLHLGYYNDIEDIMELALDPDPDKALYYYKNRLGHFHKVDPDDIEIKCFSDFEDGEGLLTKPDTEYPWEAQCFITFPTKDEIEKGGEDLFIDFYVVRGEDLDYTSGHCDECCPYCGFEGKLPRDLGVYRCPHCGKWEVNCSMCYMLDENKCNPDSCPLAYEAHRRNEIEKNEEK